MKNGKPGAVISYDARPSQISGTQSLEKADSDAPIRSKTLPERIQAAADAPAVILKSEWIVRNLSTEPVKAPDLLLGHPISISTARQHPVASNASFSESSDTERHHSTSSRMSEEGEVVFRPPVTPMANSPPARAI